MAAVNIPGEKKDFDPFPKVDNKDIEKHGKVDGNMGSHITSENLPSCVYNIAKTFREYQRKQKDLAQKYFSECQMKISNYMHDFDTKVIKNNLLNKTKNAENINLDHLENDLDNQYQNFESEKSNFLNFKKLHSRALLPNNADPDQTWIQKLILIGLVVVEFFLNLWLLQSGGATEFKAAVSISAAQTAFNIISCFLLGKYLLGQIQFKESIANKVGLIFIFIFHIYIVAVVNANMGLYRQAIVDAAEDPDAIIEGAKILNNTKLFPWNDLGNIEITSLLVMFVGIIFAFIAYLDGYKADDPYPGYGDVYRRVLKVKKSIQAKIKKINDDWTKNILDYNSSQSKLSEVGIKGINNWSHEINTIEQIRDDYLEIMKQLENEFQQAISLYVATYNRFHKDQKLSIKNVSLFTKEQYNMDKEFSDTRVFFMTDTQRLRQEEIQKNKFVKELSIVIKDVEKINTTFSERIKKLSNKYDTRIVS